MGNLAAFGRAKRPRGREALQHVAYLVPRVSDHRHLVAGMGHVARADTEDEVRLPRQGDETELIVGIEVDALVVELGLVSTSPGHAVDVDLSRAGGAWRVEGKGIRP